MKTVSVSKLKASLSAYLARVKEGEEILVTDRGRAVARLVPVAAREGVPEQLLDLERRGILTIHGTGRVPDEFWDLPWPDVPEGGSLVEAVLEERDEGW